METAWRASTAGWRSASHSTSDPTRIRSVCAASHVVVTIASNIGLSSASGGARWSIPVTPTNPAASAARARATRSSNDSRICGRNRLNSMVMPASLATTATARCRCGRRARPASGGGTARARASAGGCCASRVGRSARRSRRSSRIRTRPASSMSPQHRGLVLVGALRPAHRGRAHRAHRRAGEREHARLPVERDHAHHHRAEAVGLAQRHLELR